MISSTVIADSKNEFGNRITTMVVTFPRIILAEFNTHRMFSRNSASSRAIPFEKMVKSVEENPFIPIAWQKDHKGMQGIEYITNDLEIKYATNSWMAARDLAIGQAKYLNRNSNVSKQLCNRLLEPFMWHTVIVTATEWENFFALRCPQYSWQNEGNFRSWKDLVKASFNKGASRDWVDGLENTNVIKRLQNNKGQAEIHMMALAEAMWDAYNESTPKQLKAGEWHIPFGDNIKFPLNGVTECLEDRIKIATARCARVSYTVVGEEGKPDNYENDIKLHDRLATSGHWSPFEHCAKAMSKEDIGLEDWDDATPDDRSGNFRGFIQYRKMFANENILK